MLIWHGWLMFSCFQVQIRITRSWMACRARQVRSVVCGRCLHGVVRSLTSRWQTSPWSMVHHSSWGHQELCWVISNTTCWTCSTALRRNSMTSQECSIRTTRDASYWHGGQPACVIVGITNYCITCAVYPGVCNHNVHVNLTSEPTVCYRNCPVNSLVQNSTTKCKSLQFFST